MNKERVRALCHELNARSQAEQIVTEWLEQNYPAADNSPPNFGFLWNKAPSWAVKLSIRLHWSNVDNYEMGCDELHQELHPRLAVATGQIWQHKRTKTRYTVDCLCNSKIGGDWIDSVVYHSDSDTFSRSLGDFLLRFERVS